MRKITSRNMQAITNISTILDSRKDSSTMNINQAIQNRRRFFQSERTSIMKSLVLSVYKSIAQIFRRRFFVYNRFANVAFEIANSICARSYSRQLKYRNQGFRGIQTSLQFTFHNLNEYSERISLSPLYIRLIAGLYAKEIYFQICDASNEYFSRIEKIDALITG